MNSSSAKMKPNTTQIPNIIFEEWWRTFSGAEGFVIMIIARQTYGWHKESDFISIGQLMEKTGLSRRVILYALKSLQEKGYILSEDTPGKTSAYSINLTSPDEPKGSLPDNGLVRRTDTTHPSNARVTSAKFAPVQEMHPTSAKYARVTSAKFAPTKESKTKETKESKTKEINKEKKERKKQSLTNVSSPPLIALDKNLSLSAKNPAQVVEKYARLEDLSPGDFSQIAAHYQVPLSFVLSKYEDICLWAGERPGNPKLRGRNWRLTLMAWVKKDKLKIIERSQGDPTKRSVDARDL